MQPNKVYKSLVYLLYNVIKNEKLRFEIFNDSNFKGKMVKQIDNMLVLEKDFNQEYESRQWAETFGRAVVKITNQKQRFEKFDGLTLDDIYADYAAFISYISSSFEIGRNILTEEVVKFTEQDILIDSTLTEDVKEKYREIAIEKEKQKLEEEKQNSSKNNAQSKSKNSAYNSDASFSSNFANDGDLQFKGFNNGFTSPLKDPRFYPYNSKPLWMPWVKITFACLMISSFVILMVGIIVFATLKLDLRIYGQEFGKALFGDNIWINELEQNWDKAVTNGLASFPKRIPVGGAIAQIFPFIFYGLVVGWSGWTLLKKPKTLSEKYRISPFISIFSILILAMCVYTIATSFLTQNQMTRSFLAHVWSYVDDKYRVMLRDDKVYGITLGFNNFQKTMIDIYGKKINTISIISIISVTFSSITLIVGIVLAILNPRRDMQKLAKATMEAQRQAMAMMQGQDYVVDESIFDDENIKKSSNNRFKQWINKTFKSKKKNKDNGSEQATI